MKMCSVLSGGGSFLVFLLLIGSIWLQVVKCQDEDGDDTNSGEDSGIKANDVEVTREMSKDSMATESTGSDVSVVEGTKKKEIQTKTARLLQNFDTIRERVKKGRDVITGIIESFMGRGDAVDDEKLETALTKYDEIVEDLEADFTKAKIALGLRLENSLKRANETIGELIEKLREVNPDFVDWAKAKRGNFTNGLRGRLLRINDLLSKGVERLLEVSEMGKNTLRRIHKRRYQKRQKLSEVLLGTRKEEDDRETGKDGDSEGS